jgi:hypothetical protein
MCRSGRKAGARPSLLFVCLIASASTAASADLGRPRERATSARLGALLAPFGIGVDAVLPPTPTRHKQARLRWYRPGDADARSIAEERALPRQLVALGERTVAAPPTRPRSLQLSESQLLVVGLSAARRLRWWTTTADPRLVRAETTDPRGNLVDGGRIYRGDVTLSVDLPDDAAIVEVRLFQPRPSADGLALDALATVPHVGN